MTEGSDYSAFTRIEESYCMGDVLIASTVVIGNGVILRADPGCSITIREGACLGPGVLIHASEGSIELHQGVCLASGVLILGSGQLGKQVCVGADSTLINPCFSDGTIISSHSLWGDESRPILAETTAPAPESLEEEDNSMADDSSQTNQKVVPPSSSPVSGVIGRQQFEMMVAKMFPDRDAFKQSQSGNI